MTWVLESNSERSVMVRRERSMLDDGRTESAPEPRALNFHRSSFAAKPFFVVDTSKDNLEQSVPNGILHVQPKLGERGDPREETAYAHTMQKQRWWIWFTDLSTVHFVGAVRLKVKSCEITVWSLSTRTKMTRHRSWRAPG